MHKVTMLRKDGTQLDITEPGASTQVHCEWLARAMNACRSIPSLGYDRSGAYEYVVLEVNCEKVESLQARTSIAGHLQ